MQKSEIALTSQALMHIIINRITVNRKTCISKGKKSYFYCPTQAMHYDHPQVTTFICITRKNQKAEHSVFNTDIHTYVLSLCSSAIQKDSMVKLQLMQERTNSEILNYSTGNVMKRVTY